MLRSITSRPRFLLFARLFLALLFASALLEARPQTSLLRTDPPPGWEGFLMRTTVEAGFIPAGQDLHNATTPRVSTTNTNTAWVNPAASYPLNADVGVPTVTATRNPASGAAKDTATGTADFDYLLQQDARDQWGFDITTTTSAVNAMVDFGSGPEPADSFVEVRLEITSTGPYLVPDAWMELPPLPALNDPAREQMISFVDLGHVDNPCPPGTGSSTLSTIGYQQAPDPGIAFPFKLCPAYTSPLGLVPPDQFSYDLRYNIVTPFGTDPTYSYSGTASAAVVSPIVVTNTDDAGPGSLRQAIADAVDGDVIVFDPSLLQQTIRLTSGPLQIAGKNIMIDGDSLQGLRFGDTRVKLGGGATSQIFRIDADGGADLRSLILRDGKSTSADGGGIFSQGTLSMTNCLMENCQATGDNANGGALAVDGSTATLRRCVFRGNRAAATGGGIFGTSGARFVLTDCLIEENESQSSDGGGFGALFIESVTMTNCALIGNQAVSRGGALFFNADGSGPFVGSFVNCTLIDNTANDGAAVSTWRGEITLDFRHCTITRNQSGSTAAVQSDFDISATFFSSILSGNLPSDIDIKNGTVNSDGHNLVGGGASVGEFIAAGDLTAITDPELSVPGKFGGAAPVMFPRPGSPAVDAGSSDAATPPTDGRGGERVADGDLDGTSMIDIGAAEVARPTLIVTTATDSIPGSLRQVAAAVPDLGQVLFADELAGQTPHLTAGEITIADKTITIDATSVKNPRNGNARYALRGNGSARHLHTMGNAEVTVIGLGFSAGSPPAPDSRGGAILNDGRTLTVIDCRFESNTAGDADGGAIASTSADLHLQSSTFTRNSARTGGAVSASFGQLTVSRCRMLSNTATIRGGAIDGIVVAFSADFSEFWSNVADGDRGGAMTIEGTADISNCTFYANRAGGRGGAYASSNVFALSCRFEQCTFLGNVAGTTGGAISISTGEAELRHCTLTGNHAASKIGSGIAVGVLGSLRCFSSILSGNWSSADIVHFGLATITSDGHNLVGGGTGLDAFNAAGDRTGIHDPLLGPFGKNGGSQLPNGAAIHTLHPMPGSPAIDAGATDASSPGTDQRGEPRSVDGDGDASVLADIGAVEASGLVEFVVTNTDNEGPGSLRQALIDAGVGRAHVTFAPALDGLNINLDPTSGGLIQSGDTVFVDASSLATGVTIDAGGGPFELLRTTGTATLSKLTLRGADSHFDGGAIAALRSLKLYNCNLTNNRAPTGGGIKASGLNTVIVGCHFEANEAADGSSGLGGAIAYDVGLLQISDSTFVSNLAAFGGALYVDGSPPFAAGRFIDRCSFVGNQANFGGAISANGEITINRSSFIGNHALGWGGAFRTGPFDSIAEFDHCTFANNSAEIRGGAIHHEAGSLECRFCTISGNTAPAGMGGGIFLWDNGGRLAQLDLLSCIVAGNADDDVQEGAASVFTSSGHNLIGIGNAAVRFAAAGDRTGIIDPRLAPAAEYGGGLPTMHPLPLSPAIDAGGAGTLPLPEFDQRGFARLFDGDGDGGASVDIGAVEFAPLMLRTVTVTNLDDGGPGSLRQSLADFGPGTVIVFDPSLDGGIIPLSGPLSLQVPFVKIDASALPEGITLNGQNTTQLVEVASTAVTDLCAVTLEDGFSFDCGGGIINEGILTLNECTVRNCIAQLQGGGICNQGGRLVVRNSSLVGNEAADPDQGRGGGIYNDAELTFNTATLEQCTLADNTAGQFGGAIFNFLGRMDLRHSTVAYNTAPADGAGVATFGDLSAETHVFSSIIGSNFGTDVDFVLDPSNQFFSAGHNLIGLGNAAGAFVKPGDFNSVANPSLAPLGNYGGRTLTILPRSNSPALEGGDLPSLTLEGDQRGLPRLIDLGHDGIVRPDIGAVEVGPFPFPNNVATVTSATDFAPGSLRSILAPDIIPGTLVTFAPGLDGDAIDFPGGELVVSGLFLKIDALALPNGLELNGGGTSRIFNVASQSDLELCGLTLREGASIGAPGGAIFNEGFLTVRQCSFENNDAGQGGAIANQFGQLTLVDSTFSNNLATDGGAIHHDGDLFDRTATIDQCTFAQNLATNHGGALFNLMGIMNVRHSTISANEATVTGGGIATNGDSSVETRLFSTIAAGNTGPDLAIVLDPLDRYATDGGNVIGTTSGTAVFPGIEDQVGILDPGLSALGAHGGRTHTMVVEFGSPAREAGGTDSGSRPTDQRGFVRTFGNGPDSGAYEASGHGGYFVWASEFIPPANDRSFAGHGDDDRKGNGTEYGIDTDPGRADAASPNNPLLTEPSTQPSFTFGIRPEAFDVIWVVQRSTDLQTWTELYRYDGTTETIASDVTAVLDLSGRRITVTDDAPPTPRAFYRLAVLYNP